VLQPRLLNAGDVISRMEEMLRRLIGEHIRMVTELEPACGPVLADPGQLEQLVLNLVVNARDAMPSGGVVTVSAADVRVNDGDSPPASGLRPGRYTSITVRDTGSGMDAETRSHIFEPFFTTKAQGHGTGLGLFTVYGIVSQSEGVIDVHSSPGEGSVFTVYFPTAAGEAAVESPQAVTPDDFRGSETLLLVEDEAVVRELAARVLRGYGYTVLEAAHGAEALALSGGSDREIALMITDLVMPGGMNGRELAEQLSLSRPQMRVLYISGYADGSQLPANRDGAGHGFLPKPFAPEVLAQRVRELLDGA
jgi:CheY-like chemotaxis protein